MILGFIGNVTKAYQTTGDSSIEDLAAWVTTNSQGKVHQARRDNTAQPGNDQLMLGA